MSDSTEHGNERIDSRSVSDTSRRSVLRGIGAVGLGGSILGPAQAQDSGQSGEEVPIGIQLYTLRELDASTAELIRMAADAGYDAIEFAGVDDEEAVATALDETGIEVAGAHISIEDLEDDFQETVDTYTPLGADTFTVAYVEPENYESRESTLELAQRFNEAADRLAEQDLAFAYHNHDFEFVEVGGDGGGNGGDGGNGDGDGDSGNGGANSGDGRLAYDVLVENTNDNVLLEVDVGWVVAAGQKPVALISRYSDRVELIHMKDMVVGSEYEDGHDFAEIGEGDVNMQAVATVARREGNVDYLIYEHDEPEDPTASLQTGVEFLERINGPTDDETATGTATETDREATATETPTETDGG